MSWNVYFLPGDSSIGHIDHIGHIDDSSSGQPVADNRENSEVSAFLSASGESYFITSSNVTALENYSLLQNVSISESELRVEDSEEEGMEERDKVLLEQLREDLQSRLRWWPCR